MNKILSFFFLSRVFTLLVFALDTGKKDRLPLVGRPQLNGSIAHLLAVALGTLSVDHWTLLPLFFFGSLGWENTLSADINKIRGYLPLEPGQH